MESNFIVSLPDGFYKAIRILIQTMCMLMGQAEGIQSKQVIDLKTIFKPLLLIRLKREDITWSSVCLQAVSSLSSIY